jgi:L-threonylcarbamoyladenylate synthase
LKAKQKKLKASNKVRKLNTTSPETDIIAEAVDVMRNGGVVVFPTRSLYGLGADAFNPRAVAKIFQIKKRPISKPILVLIEDENQLDRLVSNVPPEAKAIMKTCWPGKVTIVFQAKKGLSIDLTAGTKKIGVRLAGHNIASALVKALGGPITGTSANLSGNAGCFEANKLDEKIMDGVDLVLDAGPLKGGVGSTIIDVTDKMPLILREGEWLPKGILNAIGRQ